MKIFTSANFIAVLAGLYILYSLWDDFYKKNWIKIGIGILMALLITSITIYKDAKDETDLQTRNMKSESSLLVLNSISKKVDIDSIYLHRLDSLGIHWDGINNKPFITASFIKNIRFLITSDTSNIKLTETFEDLKSDDYVKRKIAITYIINNFPHTLSDIQIKMLIDANPPQVFSEEQTKLCDLLMNQRKSIDLENYFKQIISYENSNIIAWHYLLRKDVNVDLIYIYSIIKDKPNHCIKYANIVQYAMDLDNVITCKALLNSQDLVNFLIDNSDERIYLQDCYTWINKMIARKAFYQQYGHTYFFDAIKPYVSS